jgi:tripartite-type tricarboxylate transporter receptor subunit TctC
MVMLLCRQSRKPWEDTLKALIRLVTALGALAFASAAFAQPYPDRPVRIIVPFAPGGPTDVIARIVADKLSASLGKQFYVVNQPGASGNTGAGMVATAPADGYTLITVSTGFMINPSLFAKVPYDAVKDFAPISAVATSANVLSVHPPLPAKTLKDLVDLIKAGPAKYNFASPGIGSTPHLAGELLRVTQGLDLVPVVFTGAGPAIQSTIGGHTPIIITSVAPAIPQIKEGTLRGLAVTSEKRLSALPDVPTMAEAGFPGHESYTLTGILAPAGTAKEIVALLHGEIVKTVALPDVQKRLDDLGFQIVANSPDEFAAQIKAEMTKWAKVIHDAKIKVEGAQ